MEGCNKGPSHASCSCFPHPRLHCSNEMAEGRGINDEFDVLQMYLARSVNAGVIGVKSNPREAAGVASEDARIRVEHAVSILFVNAFRETFDKAAVG